MELKMKLESLQAIYLVNKFCRLINTLRQGINKNRKSIFLDYF